MFWRDISENDGEEKLGEGGFFLIFFSNLWGVYSYYDIILLTRLRSGGTADGIWKSIVGEIV